MSAEADGVPDGFSNDGAPILAMLYKGDVDLPSGSASYALFRERVTPTLAAADLLS